MLTYCRYKKKAPFIALDFHQEERRRGGGGGAGGGGGGFISVYGNFLCG